jgi:hypothetical protein
MLLSSVDGFEKRAECVTHLLEFRKGEMARPTGLAQIA